ncbi:Prephenate dehydrogenase [Alteracholeplasma palmae J233]|uniref:Prephenate dehydrogenase n=1 Tax=Alteracholeplasma palmae (strain ATCC 49389 / J233) TaxID=1318466 RepID=U4KQL6_ALTPJ|nr:prephenate dehydrogenase [Alteracholeplasma palmae]CCV64795.1 Prephenate dehydrogenase [Alteracholeplasma palmae J233]
MKVFIIGLGLMGASYAKGLSKKMTVFGYDSNKEVTDMAMKDGIIKSNNLELIKECDLVILALYPKDNIEFIIEYKHLLNHQIITDLSGTKEWMIRRLEEELPSTVSYISHHPMAGKEKSGYTYSDEKIFNQANFLIIPTKLTKDNDITIIKKLADTLNFGRITLMTAKEHDELIAFTSQLTHILAVSLVNSDTHKHTKDATGDSYRDLTRIAKINEVMWTELFLENKEKLITEMDKLIDELQVMKQLVAENKKEALINKLKASREKRETFDNN